MQYQPGSGSTRCISMTQPLTPQLWSHLAVIVDGSSQTAVIVVDGYVQAAGASFPPLPAMTRQHHLFGRRPIIPNTGISALLDDIRIWNIARTVGAVRTWTTADLMSAPASERVGLQAFYNFEPVTTSADKTLALDLSPNNRQASIDCAFLPSACLIVVNFNAKTVCGDGKRGPSEACDDGNVASGDGCSATCTVEATFLCFQGSPGGTDLCAKATTLAKDGIDDSAAVMLAWTLRPGPRLGSVAASAPAARYDGANGLHLYQTGMFPTPSYETFPRTGLAAWLRADTGVTTTTGEETEYITRWKDQSGSGHDMVFPPSANYLGPTLEPGNDFSFNRPYVNFDSNIADQFLQFEDADFELDDDTYSIIALWRAEQVTGGYSIVGSTDGSTNADMYFAQSPQCGFYDRNMGHLQFQTPLRSFGLLGYEGCTAGKWQCQVAAIGPQDSRMYQYGIMRAHNTRDNPRVPGKLYIGRPPGKSWQVGMRAHFSEIAVFNRTLTEEEVQDIHAYYSSVYNVAVSNRVRQARDWYQIAPEKFTSFASTLLTGPVTDKSYLRFTARAEQAPDAWGVPLWVALLEDTGGVVPDPWQCKGANLCGGRRFYSICFSSGTPEAVHCDEIRDTEEGVWETAVVHVAAKFSGKYHSTHSPASSLNPAASLRIVAATIASEHAAEGFLDELHLFELTDAADCSRMQVVSVGGNAYQAHVALDNPIQYMRLGASTTKDEVSARTGIVSGGSAVPSITNQLHEADTAWSLDPGSQFLTAPLPAADTNAAPGSPDQLKVDQFSGFSFEFWVSFTDVVYGTAAANPVVWTPLLNDRSSSSSWTLRVELGSNFSIRLGVNTALGAAWRTTVDGYGPGRHYVAGAWDAVNGEIEIHVDGETPLLGRESYNNNRFHMNLGSPVFAANPLRVGWDEVFAGPSTGTHSVVLDEVAFYNKFMERHVFAARYHRVSLNATDEPLLDVGGTAPHSLARAVIGGTTLDAASPGLTMWAVSPAHSVLASETFNIVSGSPDDRESELQRMRAWVLDDVTIPVGSRVAAALAWPDTFEADVMLDEAFVGVLRNSLPVDNRVLASSTSIIYLDRMVDHEYERMWQLQAADRTWSKAADFCENVLGQRMCEYKDICDRPLANPPLDSEYNSGWHHGWVSGEGWTPVADEPDLWVSLSSSFSERRCRTYKWVSDNALNFAHSRTDKPTWTSAPSDSGIACCGRVGYFEKWRVVPEWQTDTTNFVVAGATAMWDNDYRYGVRPAHLTHARPISAPYNLYNTYSEQTAACSYRMFGQYLLLDTAAAKNWADYSIEMTVRGSNLRNFGLVFRHIDENHHYKFMFSSYYTDRCAAFSWHDGADPTRSNGNTGHEARFTQDSSKFTSALQFTTVRVDVYGNNFTAFINGQMTNNWVDTSNRHPRGSIGIFAADASAYVPSIRVYRKRPIYSEAADSTLFSLGMPPLPFQASGVSGTANRLVARGSSYAAIGLKTMPAAAAASVRTYQQNGQDTSFRALNRPQTPAQPPQGSYPAASTRGPGEGAAVVESALGCYAHTYTLPENIAPGSILPVPLRIASSTRSLTSAYRINAADADMSEVKSLANLTFSAMPEDATLRVQKADLNFEKLATHELSVGAVAAAYDSGWITMVSGCPDMEMYPDTADCVRTLPFPARMRRFFAIRDPSAIDVEVQMRPADGPNVGQVFTALGSAINGDYQQRYRWGGILAGMNSTHVRVIAPSFGRFGRGSGVNLGQGAGAVYAEGAADLLGEKNTQHSHFFQVRILAREMPAPDFDSGWIQLDASRGSNSGQEVFHGLGTYPSRVKVVQRAVDGPNSGMVFSARGDSQLRFYSSGHVGGAAYNYDARAVNVIAPSYMYFWYSRELHTLSVPPGYPTEVQQMSRRGLARVMAWDNEATEPASLQTGLDDFIFAEYDDMYQELSIMLAGGVRTPARVQPVALISNSLFSGLRAPLIGMHGNTASYEYGYYSGIVSSVNRTAIRGWGPSPDITSNNWQNWRAYAASNQMNAETPFGRYSRNTVKAMTEVWLQPPGVQDAAHVSISITDMAEPPIVGNAKWSILEDVSDRNASLGQCVGQIQAYDDDAGSVLSLEIISGNTDGGWMINGSRFLCVANPAAINFEVNPYYAMAVSVFDGTFASVAMVEVAVLNDNDRVRIWPKNLTLPENSITNTVLSPANPGDTDDAVAGSDEDEDQTIYFSIIAGNIDNAFSINACSGQVRVNQSIINFENINFYNLTVEVTDDGDIPTSARAFVTVYVTDVNDVPTLVPSTVLLPENSKAGALAGALLIDDEDNDTLYINTLFGDSRDLFSIEAVGLHPITQRTLYGVVLTDNVIAWGDGTGRNDNDFTCSSNCSGFVLDYESALMPTYAGSPGYGLQLSIQDLPQVVTNFNNHITVNLIQIAILDRNDQPQWRNPISRAVAENAVSGAVVGNMLTSCSAGSSCVTDQDAGDAGVMQFTFDNPDAVPFEVLSDGTVQVLLAPGQGLDFEAQSLFTLQVNVTDAGGPDPSGVKFNKQTTLTVALLDEPEPPVVQAGGYVFSVSELAPSGTIVGYINATDQDRQSIVTYEFVDGLLPPGFGVVGLEGAVTVVGALDFETLPFVSAVLYATDGTLQSEHVWLNITLIDENDPPEFICNSAITVTRDFAVQQDTTAVAELVSGVGEVAAGFSDQIFDMRGTITPFTRQDCEDACRIASGFNCVAATYFTSVFPLSSFRSDCFGRTAFSDIRITDPVNYFGAQSMFAVDVCEEVVSIPENPPAGLQLANFTAIDLEGLPVTFSVEPLFNRVGAIEMQGNVAVVANSDGFDFESLSKVLIGIRATDGVSNATKWLRVKLTDVNEAPVFQGDNSTYEFFVAEQDVAGTIAGQVFASDEDVGTTLQYFIVGGNDRNTFRIEADNAAGTSATLALDRTIAPSEASLYGPLFNLEIAVTDGALTAGLQLKVFINSTNSAPFMSGLPPVVSLPEDTAPGTRFGPIITVTDAEDDAVTWIMVNTVPGVPSQPANSLFHIEKLSKHTAQLAIHGGASISALGFECARSNPLPGCESGAFTQYNLTFLLSDWGKGNRSIAGSVQVQLVDSNDPPMTPSHLQLTVLENSALGTTLQDAFPTVFSPPLELGSLVDFFDAERGSLQFALSGPDAAKFSVSSANGTLIVPSASMTDPMFVNEYPVHQTPHFQLTGTVDYEEQRFYQFTITVSDGVIATPREVNVTVRVLDVQEAPVVDSGLADSHTFTISVPEGTPVGTLAGVVRASDPDGDRLYFSITGVHSRFAGGCPVASECIEQPTAGQYIETFRVVPFADTVTLPTFVPNQVQNASVRLRSPQAGQGVSVLDFEARVFYQVYMDVIDRPPGTPGALATPIILNVTVTDVNDVTVDSVLMRTPSTAVPGTFDSVPGLRTLGGVDIIEIFGSGIERTHPDVNVGATVVSVEYGCHSRTAAPVNATGDDPFTMVCDYAATSCAALTGESAAIRCNAVAGFGAGLVVRVTVNGQVRHSTASRHSASFPQLLSYIPPSISSVAFTVAGSTSGGDTFVVHGDNMGPPGTPVSAVYGNRFLQFAASSCTVLSHWNMSCSTVPGVGLQHHVSVTVGGQSSLSIAGIMARMVGDPAYAAWAGANSLNYLAPYVSSVTAATNQHAQPTTGSAGVRNIVLGGLNFGPGKPVLLSAHANPTADPAGVDTYVSFSAELNNGRFWMRAGSCVHVSQTAVRCGHPAGVGTHFAWRVTSAEQASAFTSANQTTSYTAPVITSVFGEGVDEGPTAGNSRVSISGSNLGPVTIMSKLDAAGNPLPTFAPIGVVDWLRYASPFSVLASRVYQAVGCVVRVPNSVIDCRTAPGSGYGHQFTVSIGNQQSRLHIPAVNTSYSTPFITETLGNASTGAQTAGGETLILRGSNLGPFNETIQLVLLQGFDLGDRTRAPRQYDFTGSCFLKTPHTELQCTTPVGAGAYMAFDIVIDGLKSRPVATRYLQPTLGSVTVLPPSDLLPVRNVTSTTLHSRGGDRIVVRGSNFADSAVYLTGLKYSGSFLRGGGDTQTVEYDIKDSCNLTQVHSQFICGTPAGVGTDLEVDMSIASQEKSAESVLLPPVSYAPPHLMAVLLHDSVSTPVTSAFRIPQPAAGEVTLTTLPTKPRTAGGLRLVGTNFGTQQDGLRVQITVTHGDPTLPSTRDISFSEAACFGIFARKLYLNGSLSHWTSNGYKLQDLEALYEEAVGEPLRAHSDFAPAESLQVFPEQQQSRSAPYCVDAFVPTQNHEIVQLAVIAGGQVSATPLTYSFAPPHIGDVVVGVSEGSGLGDNAALAARTAAGAPVISHADTAAESSGWRVLKLDGASFGIAGAVVVHRTEQPANASLDASTVPVFLTQAYILETFVLEMKALGLCCAAADPVGDCLAECVRADGASVTSAAFYNGNLSPAARASGRKTALCKWGVNVASENLVSSQFTLREELQFGYSHGSIRCLLPPIAGSEVKTAVAVVAAGYDSQARSNVVDFSRLSPSVVNINHIDGTELGFATVGGQHLQLVVEYAGTRIVNSTRVRIGYDGLQPGSLAMPLTDCPIDWRHPQSFVELGDDLQPCPSAGACARSREMAVLTCLLPLGEGTRVPIRVYRGSRGSDDAAKLNYAAPSIDQIVPSSTNDMVSGFPAFGTQGEQLAFVQGRNLGQLARMVQFTWGDSSQMPLAGLTQDAPLMAEDIPAGVTRAAAAPGEAAWERIAIRIPANGVGRGHGLCLTVAGQRVCSASPLFHYKAPVVQYTIGLEGVSTRGSQGLLWVVGSNFGPAFVSAASGAAAVEYSASASALPPRRNTAARRTQAAVPKYWASGVPTVGQNDSIVAFGLASPNFRLVPALWNHTHMAFEVLPSEGGSRLDMTLQIAGQLWESDPMASTPGVPTIGALTVLNFANPSVDWVASDALTGLDTTGGFNISIRGFNFGTRPSVTLGNMSVPLLVADHELVVFLLPPGVGSWDLRVFAADQAVGSVTPLTYALSTAQPMQPMRGCSERCSTVVLGGEPMAGLYTTPCSENSQLGSNSNLEALDAWTSRVTANTPDWDRSRRCLVPDRIEIRGANFGPVGAGAYPVFNGQPITEMCSAYDGVYAYKAMVPCLLPTLPNEEHSLFKLRAPPGQGTGHTLWVELPAQRNGVLVPGSTPHRTPVESVSYLPAVIRNQHPSPFLATGSDMYVFGHGLGHNGTDFPHCNSIAALSGRAAPDPSVLSIQLSGEFNCTNLCWSGVRFPSDYVPPPTGVPENGLPYLKCTAPTVPAGPHTISVTVAGVVSTNLQLQSGSATLRAFCEKAWYGLPGEYCLRCPQGGVCENCALPDWRFLQCPAGYRSDGDECASMSPPRPGPFCDAPTTEGGEPVSVKGFWRSDIANSSSDFFDDEVCDPLRQVRESCPLLLGCIPAFACVGNNTCEEGYVAERCSECKPFEFFRISGVCKECPSNPWLPIAGFIVVIIVMCGGSWYVNKKNLSLGMVAIGIDYFQVLAIFAQSNVKWPTLLLDFFNVFSYIAFNIDVAAPECLTPNLDFRVKWYLQLGLPIGVAAMLVVSYFVVWVYKRCILGQSAQVAAAHLSPCITAMVTAMYVLYLLLCRRVFDVFNCNPPVPPDPRGTTYMEATNSPCWEPGSLHMQVIPFAIFGLCFYVIGYPVFVGYFLFKFRETVKEDQHLRAIGMNYVSNSMSDNIGAIFRARYSKLYYYFKPSHYWFVLTVLARKVFLAMTSLMFRSNPGFQLAVALLIVFFSFTASVIAQPYLCASTADEVMQKHTKMVELGSRLHQKIDVELRRARDQQKAAEKRAKKGTWYGAEDKQTQKEAAAKKAEEAKKKRAQSDASAPTVEDVLSNTAHLPQNKQADGSSMMAGSILVNYNLVDQVLLANTVLVCLIGLMFESEQFASNSAANQGAVGALTGWAMLLILSGTIFYMACFGIDLYANLGNENTKSVCSRMEAQKREHGSLRKALIKRYITDKRRARQAEKAANGKLDKRKKPNSGKGTDEMLAARVRKTEETPESEAGLFMNPLLLSAGARANAAAEAIALLGAEELKAASMPEHVPPDEVYRAYVQRYEAMEARIADLQGGFSLSKSGKAGAAANDDSDGDGSESPDAKRGGVLSGAAAAAATSGAVSAKARKAKARVARRGKLGGTSATPKAQQSGTTIAVNPLAPNTGGGTSGRSVSPRVRASPMFTPLFAKLEDRVEGGGAGESAANAAPTEDGPTGGGGMLRKPRASFSAQPGTSTARRDSAAGPVSPLAISLGGGSFDRPVSPRVRDSPMFTPLFAKLEDRLEDIGGAANEAAASEAGVSERDT